MLTELWHRVRMLRALVVSAALALVSCGADPPPLDANRTRPPPPTPTPPAPVTVTLPFQVDGDLPGGGTPERALVERWASLVQVDTSTVHGLFFQARRVEPWLFDGSLLSLSGSETRVEGLVRDANGGTVHLVLPGDAIDPRAGQVLWIGLDRSSPLDPEPDVATPWLIGVLRCDDADYLARTAPDPVGELPPCADASAALATSILAIADPERAVHDLLDTLARLAMPGTSLVIVDHAADVPRPHARGAVFVPFTATRDANGITAAGTVAIQGTCVPRIPYDTFTLTVTSTTVALLRRPLAERALTTRCQ